MGSTSLTSRSSSVSSLSSGVRLARRFYNDAVTDVQRLRRHPAVVAFHLAGHAAGLGAVTAPVDTARDGGGQRMVGCGALQVRQQAARARLRVVPLSAAAVWAAAWVACR